MTMATGVLPENPTQLEEDLLEPGKLRALMNEKGQIDASKMGEFIRGYVSKVNERDKSLGAQLRSAIKDGLADFEKETGTPLMKRPPLPGEGDPRKAAGYNPAAPGAAIDGDWKSLSEFTKATWHRTIQTKGIDQRLLRNDFSGVIGADGGFLVPEILRSQLLQLAIERAIVRPRATIVPMDSLRVPFPAIDDTSHASSIMGGLIAYWTEENGSLTESQASFARVVLEANKLVVYSEVPNELIADSIISFEAFLNRAFPTAVAFFEDVAFLRGHGVGQPLGVLGAPALVSVDKETNQVAATIVWENVVKMYARMLPASLGSFVWVANINTFPQLALMSLAVGTGGSAIWLNNGTQGPPMTILGRPVIFTEKVPTLGTVGDIMAIDFDYYLVGDRQAMSMASSPHFKFQNDQTAYRITERVDGRPWVLSALTPNQGGSGSTLSPYVALATRA